MIYLVIVGIAILGGYLFMNKKPGENIFSSVAQSAYDYATDLVSQFENFSASAYKDAAGYLTIGYGHKINPGEDFPPKISQDEANVLLKDDMDTAWNAVHRHVNVPLTDNQTAALTSFVYNVGESAFKSSTLLSKLNGGDYQGAADEFLRWNKAGGTVINGLVARRTEEREIFLT